MKLRYAFVGYVAAEILAFIGMTVGLGFGWAILITLLTGLLGLLMLQWQGRKVFGELNRAARREVRPDEPVTDTVMLAGATVAVIVPGIVSTIVGILLLIPAVRRVLRPAVTAAGVRTVAAMAERVTVVSGRRPVTVIDGAVIDGDATGWDTRWDGKDPGFDGGAYDRGLPRGR